MNIAEIRQQFPQYDDMTDEALARALHQKFYADMPADQFTQKIGLAKPSGQEDPGAVQSGVIAAGRTLDKLAKGLEQGVMTAGSALGNQSAKTRLANMAKEEADNDRIYRGLEEQHPVATVVGGAAPLLPLGAVGTGVRGIAAASAIPGLVEYGTPEEKLARGAAGATGGMIGAGLGKVAGSVLQPTKSLSAAQTSAIDAADRLGVKLTAGEASGNKALRWMEAATSDMPFGAGIAQARSAANDKALASAAAKSIGQKAEEITPQVLADARAAIGGEYRRILSPAKIQLDGQFQSEVKAITGSKVMKELRDESTDALIGQFQNMPKGRVFVDGQWFQQNKTALDAAITSAYNNGQPGKAMALEKFEDALEKAAMRSLSPADRDAFKAAQKQWASLRTLETGKVVDGGRVMPGRLDQALTTRYKGAYKEGKIKGELADVASLANTLRPPPQSGTAPRYIYSGLAAGSALAHPLTSVGMLAAPPVIQGLLASPAMRKYVSKGVMKVTPEMERKMMQSAGLLGLLPATTY